MDQVNENIQCPPRDLTAAGKFISDPLLVPNPKMEAKDQVPAGQQLANSPPQPSPVWSTSSLEARFHRHPPQQEGTYLVQETRT
ncbi:uncharacterized protein N7529_010451 [Penicillium soppii]|uniref:uncharacterized protein n=1 Tax=Penicillium soppii TaxID=69789 RepID=UPI0025497BE0|nr:uncharacterized protein N7529_010451 [Penicillium soppii]KAJ5856507.1 hypothetical protein N7529_010451 [Penicillium soppii]